MPTEKQDLFQVIETLPANVQAVIEKFQEDWDSGDGYKKCQQMEDELKPLGYTFSWYLDAEPYNLRLITKEGITARIDVEIANHKEDEEYQDDDAQSDIFDDINTAFGWDWENDQDAQDYFLKATPVEVLKDAREKLQKL